MTEFLFLFGAFLAEVIGTIAGFGSSTIFLPLALFFVDFKTALILAAFFHMSGNIGRLAFFRQGINKKLALLFGIPSVLLTLIGALSVNLIHQELLKLFLGIFLVLYSLSSLVNQKMNIKASKRNAVFGGALSGFLAGLIGTGGALRSTFLISFKLKKEVYIATAAIISLAVDLTRIPVYIAGGFLEEKNFYLIPVLFLIAIAGSFTGKKIVNKVSSENFRKIVLIAISLASLKFISDGLQYLV
ncbi:MAG TPA: sulfite exporter TauE/SafE family protein [archaeon]|nr:sulfite exporter TauE/SafE family protein [archaeon]